MELTAFLNYLRHERRYAPHTCSAYQTDLEQFFYFLKSTYDETDPTAVQSMHLRAWVADLMRNKRAAASVRRKVSAVHRFYQYLLREQRIAVHPFKRIFLPKKRLAAPAFIRQDALATLFADDQAHFPDTLAGLRDRCILELLYATGIRRSELINSTLRDVDWRSNTLRVFGKGQKERLVPLHESAMQGLHRYLDARQAEFPTASDRLLLTDKGEPLYPKFVYNKVKHYLSRVTTAAKRSPHTLRHSFATHLSNNGADLNAIKELLGHANLAATQIYTHNSLEKLKQAYAQAHPRARRNPPPR